MTDMDTTCSCGIGDDLRIYGSSAAISRVQELFDRRDHQLDAGLPKNRRAEDARAGLGIERMSIGTGKDGQPLDVTGNTDAMTRMQAIYLADSRRRGNPNWAQNLASTTSVA